MDPVVKDQLDLIRLRNTSPAFNGEFEVIDTEPNLLQIAWKNKADALLLKANLRDHSFSIIAIDKSNKEKTLMNFAREK